MPKVTSSAWPVFRALSTPWRRQGHESRHLPPLLLRRLPQVGAHLPVLRPRAALLPGRVPTGRPSRVRSPGQRALSGHAPWSTPACLAPGGLRPPPPAESDGSGSTSRSSACHTDLRRPGPAGRGERSSNTQGGSGAPRVGRMRVLRALLCSLCALGLRLAALSTPGTLVQRRTP